MRARRPHVASFTFHMPETAREVAQARLAAGHAERQILEVIPGIGLKVPGTYTCHFAGIPPNAAFADLAWTKPAELAAE